MNIKLLPEEIQALRRYPAFKDTEPPFIFRFDPSTLSNSYCNRKVELTNLLGLRTKHPDPVASYGSAVHLAVAERRRGRKVMDAIRAGVDYFIKTDDDPQLDWRNEAHLFNVLNRYFNEYQHDTFMPMKVDDMVAVEQSFAIEDFFDCGDIVFFLVGAIDAVGKCHAPIEITDIKTTASKYSPTRFLAKYRYSHQLMLYSWAVKQLELCDYYPPAFIDGVFLCDGSPFAKFERSPVWDYAPEDVDTCVDWAREQCRLTVEELVSRLPDMIADKSQEAWMQRNPAACELYGGCKFTDLCWGTQMQKEFMRQRYVQSLYDPRTFGQQPDQNDNS